MSGRQRDRYGRLMYVAPEMCLCHRQPLCYPNHLLLASFRHVKIGGTILHQHCGLTREQSEVEIDFDHTYDQRIERVKLRDCDISISKFGFVLVDRARPLDDVRVSSRTARLILRSLRQLAIRHFSQERTPYT